MSGEPKVVEETLLRRVPVILRSWDGPNSRIGLEVDLSQMPWGPFDALGKRLNILLPAGEDPKKDQPGTESQIERALRYVEHAADRCGEFAVLTADGRDTWLRSQETWEWIRKYLTSLWVATEVEGRSDGQPVPASLPDQPRGDKVPDLPALPGAASTLEVAAKALRGTPLAVWRETVGSLDAEAPTREEAVQTLLGVARVLSGNNDGKSPSRENPPAPPAESPDQEAENAPAEPPDPDQVSFDFARGYDEGYQMGRKVGMALMGRGGRKKET